MGVPTGDDGWLLQGSADPGEISAYYDRWAETYDDDLDTWSYRSPAAIAGFVVEHAPDVRSVLDAGCGTGLAGRALRRAGFDGVLDGIDVSAASVSVAAGSDTYTTLAVADLQQPFDIADDRYDALMCVGVMTYLPDVEATWREFSRVVAPGGVVALSQREDLWLPRRCAEVIDRLASTGMWEPLAVTDPMPYLPENDDYADRIGVHYLVARILPSQPT